MATLGHYQGFVWNKTGYSRGIKATLAQVAAIPNPKVGETVFCSENGRIHTFDGDLWMCDDFIKSINGDISTRIQGDVMVFQSTIGATESVITTGTSGDTRFAGVVAFSAAPGQPVALAYKGKYKTKMSFFAEAWDTDSWGKPIRTSSLNGGMETISYNVTNITSGHCGWLGQLPASATVPQLCWCILRGKTEYYF